MGKKTAAWCVIVVGVLMILFLSIPLGGAVTGSGIAWLIQAGKKEKEESNGEKKG